MKLHPNKTFPHPVLRSDADDYINRQFQATREFSVDQYDAPVLDYRFTLSEESIINLLKNGQATYSVEIHCPTTLLRQVDSTTEDAGTIKLRKGDLYRKVEVNAFVVCTKPIQGYSSLNFNKEFGSFSPDLLPGDVLAAADTEIYYWDTEVVAPLRSVFDLVADDATQVGTFDVDTSGDKVKIRMHPGDKSRFDQMRKDSEQRPAVMLIYFSAVAEVLRQMKDAEGEGGEDKKWYRTIEHKLTEIGGDLSSPSDDLFVLAQRLLGKPLSLVLPKPD